MSRPHNQCTECGADLTIPESVTRVYVNKDEGENCAAEGHYSKEGDFESDRFGGFDGDRYDCLDDADSCSACEAPL